MCFNDYLIMDVSSVYFYDYFSHIGFIVLFLARVKIINFRLGLAKILYAIKEPQLLLGASHTNESSVAHNR